MQKVVYDHDLGLGVFMSSDADLSLFSSVIYNWNKSSIHPELTASISPSLSFQNVSFRNHDSTVVGA